MLTWVAMWCVAWAAPQTVELASGVRLVVDTTSQTDERLDVAWFSATGSADAAPGATAMALIATMPPNEGPSSTDVWARALDTQPSVHLCARDAAAMATIDAGDLEAWAWLARAALLSDLPADLHALHAASVDAFPQHPMDGVDRAPSPWSWPGILADDPPDPDTVRLQQHRLREPHHLTVVVRGAVSTEQVTATLTPYFALDSSSVPNTPDRSPFQRLASVTAQTPGPPMARIHTDVPADQASRDLARTLDTLAGSALGDVAFDARVRLIEDAPVWTLVLDAQPAPGAAERVPAAWTAWLQTLQGVGLPPTPAPPQTTLVALGHAAVHGVPAQGTTREAVLAQLVAAPSTTLLSRPDAVDPELDALRRTLGELTVELVRIRLRGLETTPDADVPAWIEQIRAERQVVAPRLRPALDLLITRAQARL